MYPMKCVFHVLLTVKLYQHLNPLEAFFRVHRGAVAQHSSDKKGPQTLSQCCSSPVVAWSKVVEDLNPADLWILFIMSTDY